MYKKKISYFNYSKFYSLPYNLRFSFCVYFYVKLLGKRFKIYIFF